MRQCVRTVPAVFSSINFPSIHGGQPTGKIRSPLLKKNLHQSRKVLRVGKFTYFLKYEFPEIFGLVVKSMFSRSRSEYYGVGV